ncbi:MAG: YfbK domain-containing protein [Bacteroidota bacterium]
MKTIASTIVMLLVALLFSAAGQPQTITGTVTSADDGSPLPGVSVSIKGTARGTVTDFNGSYSIIIQPGDQTLVFSFIGMETKEVAIAGRNTINVAMESANVSMDEVVVVGYNVRQEQYNTGSVAVISGNPGYTQTLQGRAAGVSVSGREKKASTYYMAEACPQPVFNTEGYSAIHENGFKDVYNNPLSTFSIDVDNASYANVRRFINSGSLPPEDAVRIEEMVNYFNYSYPEPDGEHPFSVYTELSVCPWNSDHQLLHIGLKGKEIDKRELPASNLVFLLDVSGSMQDANKLPLLKSAFSMLVNNLRNEDRVAIVVYAGAAGVVLESTPGNRKEQILAAIEQLQAGGSTAGGEGIKLAYSIAEKNYREGGNNRIILATDGDFNVGASSDGEMERLIEKEREKGIFITVLGFGMGNYKDSKMEVIADKGNGNYAYIDNLQEAQKVLISEFGGTLFTIAKDVKFQIEFNPARVESYRLVGYENRLLNDEDFNDDKKDAGEMGAGHTVTALYEIVPAGSKEKHARIDPLKYQSDRKETRTQESEELMTVKLRYKQPDGFTSKLMEIPVQGKVLDLDETSDNFRFSAAVAEFGMLLRNSEYLKDINSEDILELARTARGEDEEGYRAEFIKLVKTAGAMTAMK